MIIPNAVHGPTPVRRRSLLLFLLALVALLAPTTPAIAADPEGTPHPHVMRGGTDDGSVVVAPGKTASAIVPLVNKSRKKQKAWVTFSRLCFVDGRQQRKIIAQKRVTVPGDKQKIVTGAYPVAFVAAKVRVTKECAESSEGYGDTLGWTITNVTKDRPTAVAGGVDEFFKWGKPNSKKNRKFNFKIHQKRPTPAKHYKLHHAYPVKHAKKFSKVLIDVNDARHLRWWCNKKGNKDNFRSRKGAYNAAWNRFFKKNKKPSLSKVILFRRNLEHPSNFRYHC